MKPQVINIDKIEAVEFSSEATILTLDSEPTTKQQNELCNNDDSIVLLF